MKYYKRIDCFFCGFRHAKNGLSHTFHMRKHVREGILSESRDKNRYFVFDLISRERWKELYPEFELKHR